MTELPAHLVVDAWPLMEWVLAKEPVASLVDAIVSAAGQRQTRLSISRINYGECIYLVRKNLSAEKASVALKRLQSLPLQLLSVSDELIDRAVELKSTHAISYADAFAVAQAAELSVPLLTGDLDLLEVQRVGAVHLYWIGR